jgi:hypothetical protein
MLSALIEWALATDVRKGSAFPRSVRSEMFIEPGVGD